MPQQLFYTSAPRGLIAGRSGFCTVARSKGMRDALALRLQQFSYYEHRALAGGDDHVICACRLVDIRGARFHLLSRIQDAGLDFTNRTNFFAHHLVFTPEELADIPSAPVIFRYWNGWVASWSKDPCVLTAESWGNLYDLASSQSVSAVTWARVTGDGANSLALLDRTSGTCFDADGLDEDSVLALLAESLALLEAREPSADFRAGAWRFTFTTSLQEQDQPADFIWRCAHSDSPAFRRLAAAGQPALPLASLRPTSCTEEAVIFARSGPQPPRITREPQDHRPQPGATVVLRVEASGVPAPRQFQWFTCARDGTEEALAGQTTPELRLQNLGLGVSRYLVKVANARGQTATSRVAQVAVEKTLDGRFGAYVPRNLAGSQTGSCEVAAEEPKAWTADAEEMAAFLESLQRQKRRQSRKALAAGLIVVLFVAAALGLVRFWQNRVQTLVNELTEARTNRWVEKAAALTNLSDANRLLLFRSADVKRNLAEFQAFIKREYDELSKCKALLSRLPTNSLPGADDQTAQKQFHEVEETVNNLAPALQRTMRSRLRETKLLFEDSLGVKLDAENLSNFEKAQAELPRNPDREHLTNCWEQCNKTMWHLRKLRAAEQEKRKTKVLEFRKRLIDLTWEACDVKALNPAPNSESETVLQVLRQYDAITNLLSLELDPAKKTELEEREKELAKRSQKVFEDLCNRCARNLIEFEKHRPGASAHPLLDETRAKMKHAKSLFDRLPPETKLNMSVWEPLQKRWQPFDVSNLNSSDGGVQRMK